MRILTWIRHAGFVFLVSCFIFSISQTGVGQDGETSVDDFLERASGWDSAFSPYHVHGHFRLEGARRDPLHDRRISMQLDPGSSFFRATEVRAGHRREGSFSFLVSRYYFQGKRGFQQRAQYTDDLAGTVARIFGSAGSASEQELIQRQFRREVPGLFPVFRLLMEPGRVRNFSGNVRVEKASSGGLRLVVRWTRDHRTYQLNLETGPDRNTLDRVRFREERDRRLASPYETQVTLSINWGEGNEQSYPEFLRVKKNNQLIGTWDFGFEDPSASDIRSLNSPAWAQNLPGVSSYVKGESDGSTIPTGMLSKQKEIWNAGHETYRKRLRVRRETVNEIVSDLKNLPEASPYRKVSFLALQYSYKHLSPGYHEDISEQTFAYGEDRLLRILQHLYHLNQKEKEQVSEHVEDPPGLFAYGTLLDLINMRSRLQGVEDIRRLILAFTYFSVNRPFDEQRVISREMRARLLGRPGREGLFKGRGRRYLEKFRDQDDTTAFNYFLARTHMETGFFSSADRYFLKLGYRPELKETYARLIRIGAGRAAGVAEMMTEHSKRPELLLYAAWDRFEREETERALSLSEQILTYAREQGGMSVFREEMDPLQSLFDHFLEQDRVDLARGFMKQIVRENAGAVLSRSRFHDRIRQVFGDHPAALYPLYRVCPVPINLERIAPLAAVAGRSVQKLEEGEADDRDIRFLIRVERQMDELPFQLDHVRSLLIDYETDQAQLSHDLQQSIGNFYIRDENWERARNAYMRVFRTREKWVQEGSRRHLRTLVERRNESWSQGDIEQAREVMPNLNQPFLPRLLFLIDHLEEGAALEEIMGRMEALLTNEAWSIPGTSYRVWRHGKWRHLAITFFMLGKIEPSVRRMRKRSEWEVVDYPPGGFRSSATFWLGRMLRNLGQNEEFRERYRTHILERTGPDRTVPYREGPGAYLFRNYRRHNRTEEAQNLLDQLASHEWNSTDRFSFSGSASEALFEWHREQENEKAAEDVLVRSCRRALLNDEPRYRSGGAFHQLVTWFRDREEFGRALNAIRVASSAIEAEPDLLKEDRSAVRNAYQTRTFVETFIERHRNTTVSEEDRDRIQSHAEKLGSESLDTHMDGFSRLLEMGTSAVPVLAEIREDADSETRSRLHRLMEQMAAEKYQSRFTPLIIRWGA